uniref:Odorant receptor n=1 Tax=Phlebotomus papatasi TaxID=29031 RepID=A0A3F2ZEF7_PHLPP
MSYQRHSKVFNKINKILEIKIPIASFCVTNEPLMLYRVLIRAPFIATVMCILGATMHIANTFEGYLNTNIAVSLIILCGSIQVFFKTFSMRYHQKSVTKIMYKIKSLHNQYENTKLNYIAEESLTKFGNIWIICCRLETALMFSAVTSIMIYNIFKGDSGTNIEIPFLPKTIFYYNKILQILQLILTELATVCVICTDMCLAFFVFEILAASEILCQYISLNINIIDESPDFFKIITLRYFEIVKSIKLFNSIYSIMSLVQFVTSAFLSFITFFIVQTNPMNPIGYVIVLAILSQFFIPCLFGELLKVRIEKFSTVLNFANWYDFSLKNQKKFLFILGITQKEYGLKAAGMFDINIFVFIDIVKMALSWCTFVLTLGSNL